LLAVRSGELFAFQALLEALEDVTDGELNLVFLNVELIHHQLMEFKRVGDDVFWWFESSFEVVLHYEVICGSILLLDYAYEKYHLSPKDVHS